MKEKIKDFNVRLSSEYKLGKKITSNKQYIWDTNKKKFIQV